MDIDEFLDKETSKLGGKAQIVGADSPSSFTKASDDNLFEHLEIIKEKLKEKKISSAIKEFDFLKGRYTDMTQKQLRENRFLFNELLNINEEIVQKIEMLRADALKKRAIVQKLLQDAQMRLKNGELDVANKLYIQIKEILKQIPDIFAEEKRVMGNFVTAFSVYLKAQLMKREDYIFTEKKRLLVAEIQKAYNVMEQGGGGQVQKELYESINAHFTSLPEGHLYEKIILYNDILKLFRSASLAEETKMVLESLISHHQKILTDAMGQGTDLAPDQESAAPPGQQAQKPAEKDVKAVAAGPDQERAGDAPQSQNKSREAGKAVKWQAISLD